MDLDVLGDQIKEISVIEETTGSVLPEDPATGLAFSSQRQGL